MGVDALAVAHAVTEARWKRGDPVTGEQVHVVVVDRGDVRGDGDVDRDCAAVVLRNLDGHRVAADARILLPELEIEEVEVVAERPGRAEARDAATDDADALATGGHRCQILPWRNSRVTPRA